ncbi:MAG: hypothetical protein VB142_08285 [Burkholderia sp.]
MLHIDSATPGCQILEPDFEVLDLAIELLGLATEEHGARQRYQKKWRMIGHASHVYKRLRASYNIASSTVRRDCRQSMSSSNIDN